MTERLDTKFRELVRLRREHELKKRASETAEKEYRTYEAQLWDEMEDTGQQSIKLDLGADGVISFVRRETISARILDKDTLLDALEQSALSDEFVTIGFQKARLNSLVNERIKQGRPLPEGCDFASTKRITHSKK
jgi:hypothetical protein